MYQPRFGIILVGCRYPVEHHKKVGVEIYKLTYDQRGFLAVVAFGSVGGEIYIIVSDTLLFQHRA